MNKKNNFWYFFTYVFITTFIFIISCSTPPNTPNNEPINDVKLLGNNLAGIVSENNAKNFNVKSGYGNFFSSQANVSGTIKYKDINNVENTEGWYSTISKGSISLNGDNVSVSFSQWNGGSGTNSLRVNFQNGTLVQDTVCNPANGSRRWFTGNAGTTSVYLINQANHTVSVSDDVVSVTISGLQSSYETYPLIANDGTCYSPLKSNRKEMIDGNVTFTASIAPCPPHQYREPSSTVCIDRCEPDEIWDVPTQTCLCSNGNPKNPITGECEDQATLQLSASAPQIGTEANGILQSRFTVTPSNDNKQWTLKVTGPQKEGCQQYTKTYSGSGEDSSHILPDGISINNLVNGDYSVEAYYNDIPTSKQTTSVNVKNKVDLEVTIPEGKGLNSEKIFSAVNGGQVDFRIVAPSCPEWELKIDGKKPDTVNADGTTTPGASCSWTKTGTGNQDVVAWNGTCDDGRIMDDGTYTATLTSDSQTASQEVKLDNTPPEISNINVEEIDNKIKLSLTFSDPKNVAGIDSSAIKVNNFDSSRYTVSDSTVEIMLNNEKEAVGLEILVSDLVKNQYSFLTDKYEANIEFATNKDDTKDIKDYQKAEKKDFSSKAFSTKGLLDYQVKVGPGQPDEPIYLNFLKFTKRKIVKGSHDIVIKRGKTEVFKTTVKHTSANIKSFGPYVYVEYFWNGKGNLPSNYTDSNGYLKSGEYTAFIENSHLEFEGGVGFALPTMTSTVYIRDCNIIYLMPNDRHFISSLGIAKQAGNTIFTALNAKSFVREDINQLNNCEGEVIGETVKINGRIYGFHADESASANKNARTLFPLSGCPGTVDLTSPQYNLLVNFKKQGDNAYKAINNLLKSGIITVPQVNQVITLALNANFITQANYY